jgi:putative ABC transport system permease protein
MKETNEPPRRALQLLKFFSEKFSMPEIYGDLIELFYKNQNRTSIFSKIKFWLSTLLAIPGMWLIFRRRNKKSFSINPFHMFFSNLIIGLRHILKKPVYSFTTIVGLTLGIVTCLVILFYVRFEKSFDQYHEHINELAVVHYNVKMNDAEGNNSSAPQFVGPNLEREFPEVILQCRVLPNYGTRVVTLEDKMFEEGDFAFADSTFFQAFTIRLLKGNPSDQLKRPQTIVLSEKMVTKYFGNDEAIGKTIKVGATRLYEVTGVMENMPVNSHSTYDMLLSMSTLELPTINKPTSRDWNSPNFVTYLLLAKNINTQAFTEKINKTWLADSETLKLDVKPLKTLHFDTSTDNYGNQINIVNGKYLRIFTVVAFLILIIACINYINLVTARASERGREVGIRKISGATQHQLFWQFITDSFLHIFSAVLLSLFLFFGLLPFTGEFLGLNFRILSIEDYSFIFQVAGLILTVVTIAAGLYPAAIMTRFKPVSILKGKFSATRNAVTLRKSLVVFQFSISMGLIICAAIVSGQLTFMQNKSLGFDKEHVLILQADQTVLANLDAFKNEMEKLNAVASVIPASTSPTDIVIGYGARIRESEDNTMVGAFSTNEDFVPAMRMSILAGRNIDASSSDSTSRQFLVNETFVTKFGFTFDDVIGRKILLGIVGEGEIIGVINDFHTGSLHRKIEPVVIYSDKNWYQKILIKLQPGNTPEQLAEVESVWKKLVSHRPFAYSFLDENYNSLYKKEIQVNHLVYIFAALAIIIACLGILGLASYNAVQRAKEIGIRKVLGASTSGIMILMMKDFLVLLSVAFLLSVPMAYFFSNDWLQYFEYRISITVFHFIVAGAIAFTFAIFTIAYQTMRASQANPAVTLKVE